ncbi:hypothetical protein [Pseudomonas sp. GM84]|uniref:hypothetical protein n=1 Tax=Pseudomonas sp. GM84 TaxID=1144340 RepID=UPI001EE67F1E|nr:hypothetical protein [Pseudomonas sp. GM84]
MMSLSTAWEMAMDIEPTNQQVAIEVGIEEEEVERYRRESLLLGDGSWLVHFAYEMPKELRHRFIGSFTAIVKANAPREEDREYGEYFSSQ